MRTGRLRVFRRHELSAAAVLASACLPLMFRAVHVEGEPYWDGGYAGNPPLLPLVSHSPAHDLLLVQINPVQRETVAAAASTGEGHGDGAAQALADDEPSGAALPTPWAAAAPIVLVVALNYVFPARLIPALDTGYLAQRPYGPVVAVLAPIAGLVAVVLATAFGSF